MLAYCLGSLCGSLSNHLGGRCVALMRRQRGAPTSMLRGDTAKVCAFAQNGRRRAHCLRLAHVRLQTRWTPECSASACVSEPDRSSGDSAGNADNGEAFVPLRLGMNWGEPTARPRRFWRSTRGPRIGIIFWNLVRPAFAATAPSITRGPCTRPAVRSARTRAQVPASSRRRAFAECHRSRSGRSPA